MLTRVSFFPSPCQALPATWKVLTHSPTGRGKLLRSRRRMRRDKAAPLALTLVPIDSTLIREHTPIRVTNDAERGATQ